MPKCPVVFQPPPYENLHDSHAEFWFKAAAIVGLLAGGFALIL